MVPWPVHVAKDLWASLGPGVLVPRPQTKLRVLRRFARALQADAFLESGTWMGETSRRMARVVPHVVTVELDAKLAADAKARLAGVPNVSVRHGLAEDLIPEALAQGDYRRALVYLDGHYSGPGTAKGPEDEPALTILPRLARHKEKIAAILVDDVRTFDGRMAPRLSELLAVVEKEFPEYELVTELDQLRLVRPGAARAIK